MANEDTNQLQSNANVEPEAADSPSKDPNSDTNNAASGDHPDIPIDQLIQEISEFATSLSVVDEFHPLETPKHVNVFLDKLEHYESNPDPSFFKAISALSLLIESVSKFKSASKPASILLNLATSHLHRAMLVLEDDLRSLLHKWAPHPDTEADHCVLPDPTTESSTFPRYSPDDISTIIAISNAMISAGYGVDCVKVFMVVRRAAFEDELATQGFEKTSIDDVQRIHWEALENEIATWIKIVKQCTSLLFPGELAFYQSVFSETKLPEFDPNHDLRTAIFNSLARPVLHQLLTLPNAVSLTKKSSEKLFKFLDMYETLRELGPWLESCDDLKLELSSASLCLGESAISIFYELEESIKTDQGKQPVPNGAVHPLTRYTMNYLKYACEYKDSLEELFLHHANDDNDNICAPAQTNGRPERSMTPFINQLMRIMDLLDENLEAKSKLYRDPSLRYIFLMNNGRYMLQKIRGSTEIHQAMGDNWCRRRSAELRSHHKNYQRDTWSKVLQCLNHEGLQVNGKVQKLVLKERFKSFNQSFDEIHRTQSMWVVSDEQMKSELRVSISAVMIPAYRAFLARFGQAFSAGRQYEKHIKYQPDDVETAIEELFEGSASSMARRR